MSCCTTITQSLRSDPLSLLTIVTPTWNIVSSGRAESLATCVKSVSELPVEVEHLIVDGGSRDGTTDLLKRLQGEGRVFKFLSEPDQGVYDAMNRGVSAATGKYIYFLGSDDAIVDGEAFKEAMTAVEQANADMCVSPVFFHGKDARKMLPVAYKGLFCENPYPHQGVVMRADLVRELGGFRLNHKICADYDLILRAHLRGIKSCYSPHPYALYSGDGMSSDFALTWHDNIQVATENLGLTAEESAYAEMKRVTPLRLSLRYAFHRDRVVRIAARHQLKRWVADRFGLLSENGAMRI